MRMVFAHFRNVIFLTSRRDNRREVWHKPSMKEIPLTRGKVAIVDDCDYEELSTHRWLCTEHGYVRRSMKKSEGDYNRKVYMHRQVSGAREQEIIDHINGDKLDNRRCNLRICTQAQNVLNARVSKNNKLGIKGVSFRANRYEAKVFHNGKNVFYRRFKTLEEAKAAYDHHSKLHHGEFSRS